MDVPHGGKVRKKIAGWGPPLPLLWEILPSALHKGEMKFFINGHNVGGEGVIFTRNGSEASNGRIRNF